MIESQSKKFWLDELGGCLCGRSIDGLRYMRDVLYAQYVMHNESTRGVSVVDSTTDAYQFALHALTGYGLLEHGSNIIGSWLTDKGKELMDYLFIEPESNWL